MPNARDIGVEHVVDEPLDLGADLAHGRCRLTENGVSEHANVENGHAPSYSFIAGALVLPPMMRAIRPRSTMRRDSADLMVM